MQQKTCSESGLVARSAVLLMLAALSCAPHLITVATAHAGEVSATTSQVTTTVTQPSVNDPSIWIGRNISAVVDRFGQPSYWNAGHDGGGGGGRYIYNKPNQPHLVFETQPGGMIVRAVRVP